MDQFVIDRMRASLRNRVTTPADAGYDEARTTFNATVRRRPAAIVRVRNVEDVVAAVVAAGDLGLPIAIRGGGHSVAGHGMADDALVVDLRDRREVVVDPSTGIIRVAGGAQWEDVDTAAWRHGLTLVGGTFGDTGVAGLTLGGGIGWLIGVQGFTCDNLTRAEVVTAAGERVVAGPDGDPELLWALRGGGGNFGVVTTFEFQARDPGPIIAGTIAYPGSAAKQVLRRVAEVAATAPDALELMAWIGRERDALEGPPVLALGICLPGSQDAADEVLHPLRGGLPVLRDEVMPRPYPDVQAMNGRLPFGLRHYWKGHFLRDMDEPVIEAVVGAIADHPGGTGGILLEAIRGAGRVEPAGGTAFAQRSAAWNASALAIWTEPDDDDAHVGWARRTTDRLSIGSLNGAGYANYAPVDETIERVRLSFGADRFARLAAVKARYDPDNQFRFNLNVAPAMTRPATD